MLLRPDLHSYPVHCSTYNIPFQATCCCRHLPSCPPRPHTAHQTQHHSSQSTSDTCPRKIFHSQKKKLFLSSPCTDPRVSYPPVYQSCYTVDTSQALTTCQDQWVCIRHHSCCTLPRAFVYQI